MGLDVSTVGVASPKGGTSDNLEGSVCWGFSSTKSCLPSNYHSRILRASLVIWCYWVCVSSRSEFMKQLDGARGLDDEMLFYCLQTRTLSQAGLLKPCCERL